MEHDAFAFLQMRPVGDPAGAGQQHQQLVVPVLRIEPCRAILRNVSPFVRRYPHLRKDKESTVQKTGSSD